MAVNTYIANLALGHFGNDSISSYEENSKPGRTIRTHYDQAIELALEAFDWPFARVYAATNVVADATLPDGWGYAYNWLGGALAVRRIRKLAGEDDIAFEQGISADQTSRLIYTNRNSAVFVWTVRPKSEELFTPSFKEVAGWSLARLTAMPITKDLKMKDYCEKGFIRSVQAASAISANEDGDDLEMFKKDPDWIVDRGGSSVVLPPVTTD